MYISFSLKKDLKTDDGNKKKFKKHETANLFKIRLYVRCTLYADG